MIYFPSCKINLGLHILQKRADGYHEIETGMLEIPFRDLLEIAPSAAFRFTTSGLAIPAGENSCVAAYDLLNQHFALSPVHLHLHKMVPMGGGLGGGSADSTATLKALNDWFELGLSNGELMAFAAQLGSDNAFFVEGGFQLARGRGELLQPLPPLTESFHICVVNIGIHVPTKTAYAQVTPSADRPELRSVLEQPVATWKTDLVNDFEAPVFALHPQLQAIKHDLYAAGAVYAAMSGSGSTLFGLFRQQPAAIHWSFTPVYTIWV